MYEWGRIEIRRGNLKLAREKLEQARKVYEDLGTPLFIEKVNREIKELEKIESTQKI